MTMPVGYTQVSKFQVSGKTRHGKTYTKRFSQGGTPINLGVSNRLGKPSQIVYGSVVVGVKANFGSSFIEFGTATVSTGRGKSKVVYTFPVFRTEAHIWEPDLIGFSI